MVFHLLVFRTIVSEKCASGEQKVGARSIKTFVNKEILLFPTEIGRNFLHIVIEVSANFESCLVNCRKRFLQRCFIIQRFSCVTDENRGNHQGVTNDKHRACRIPSGIATRFECRTDSSIRKRWSVRLLLYKEFTRKFFYHAAFAIVFDKSIVFFGSTFCEWLKPVCVVCHSHFNSPLFHALSYHICRRNVKRSAIVQRLHILLIGAEREIFAHLLLRKYIFAVVFWRTFGWYSHRHWTFLKRLFDHFESQCTHLLRRVRGIKE